MDPATAAATTANAGNAAASSVHAEHVTNYARLVRDRGGQVPRDLDGQVQLIREWLASSNEGRCAASGSTQAQAPRTGCAAAAAGLAAPDEARPAGTTVCVAGANR